VTQDRTATVTELVAFARPVADILQELAAFGWDSHQELTTLQPAHVEAVLNRFLSGELSATEVEDWANAIECRDDIGFDRVAADAVDELANPLLTRSLTRQSAVAMVGTLQGAAT
jgi:hypothetical protein